MGKIINMMQSNLFGKKKTLENNEESSNTNKHINDDTSCTLPSLTFTIDGSRERKDISTSGHEDMFATNVACETPNVEGVLKREEHIDIKKVLKNYNNENIEEKLYELERCYLFEQNNIIDKYEAEKSEMLEKHAEEKLLAKRAYEHEKDELLKEIQRKDKMLFELTNLMKEECTKKLEEQKEEFESIINSKNQLYLSIEEKLKTFIGSLTNFFKNNERVTESITEFKELLNEYELFLKSIDLEKTSNELLNPDQLRFDNEIFFPFRIRTVERQISDPNPLITNVCKPTTYDNENLNSKRQSAGGKVVSRTLSDNIRFKSECCRKHARDCSNSDEAIQHELAQAYRKQKTELLKLFNSEKEQYEKKVNKEKDYFERETRAEYVKRMAVERKAWQETIEDYEREIAILKYERQQMDTNYCVGMDKMKTEFEREKNAIHRRYGESCIQLKKNLEEKMKNTKIVNDIKEPPP